MARHSTGTNNNRVAGSFIFSVIAVVVALALVAWWLIGKFNSDNQSQASRSCDAGEISVAVAGDNPDLIKSLVGAYNDSKPVVNDKCVTAAATVDLASAAVYLTSGSDKETADTLRAANRTAAATDWPVVNTIPVGVATKSGFTWDSNAPIAYASKGNQLASAFVAAAKNPDPTKVAETVAQSGGTSLADASAKGTDNLAVAENSVPVGYTFVKGTADGKDLTIPQRAVPLNATGKVTQEVQAAAKDLASTQTVADGNPLTSLTGIAAAEGIAQAAALPTSTPQAPAHASVVNTVFLFDTSYMMGATAGDSTWFAVSSSAIHDTALRIGEAGKQVSLWNYSSPIAPGVKQGWRTNVGLEDNTAGYAAADAVLQFGVGGDPQTRSALAAVLRAAAAQGGPLRVVLIASGTVDSYDLQPAVDAAKSEGIMLDVIHVGPNQPNQAVVDAAVALGGTTAHIQDPAQLAVEVNKVTGV